MTTIDRDRAGELYVGMMGSGSLKHPLKHWNGGLVYILVLCKSSPYVLSPGRKQTWDVLCWSTNDAWPINLSAFVTNLREEWFMGIPSDTTINTSWYRVA